MSARIHDTKCNLGVAQTMRCFTWDSVDSDDLKGSCSLFEPYYCKSAFKQKGVISSNCTIFGLYPTLILVSVRGGVSATLLVPFFLLKENLTFSTGDEIHYNSTRCQH